MSRRMPLVHPRMLAQVGDQVYPDFCTIQSGAEAQDASGFPVAAFSDVAGLAAIPCRLSPLGGGETKSPSQVYAVATHAINLRGYYPAITPKMRAQIQGQAYDVLLVEHDGQRASTRLVAQVVS